jgi:AraC-like DNA-binding protein
MQHTSYVASLLTLMPFQTYDRFYLPRLIYPGREEMELVLDGNALLKTKDAEYRVGPGDLVWHRPGDQTISSCKDGQPYECMIMAFKLNPMRSLRKARLNRWSGVISARQFADDALRHLTEQIDDHDYAEYLYCALKVHTTPVWNTQPHTLSHSSELAFDKAFQQISLHFKNKSLSVEAVAESANISASKLHSLFKERLNKTPYQLINQCRMEYALRLLAENRSIKQITTMSGFDSESGFIRAFKKKYGCSPGSMKTQQIAYKERTSKTQGMSIN